MIRTALLILLTLVIAIFGGAASVAYVLDRDIRPWAAHVGPWIAYPDNGTADADPYYRAKVAVTGSLPLGRAEGLVFQASRDDDGNTLLAQCTYLVVGQTPPARFWTLRAEAETAAPLVPDSASTLHSRSVVRTADNGVEIAVGALPAPGNWLRTGGQGDMKLMLTIYDALVKGGPMADTMTMPSIRRTGCDE